MPFRIGNNDQSKEFYQKTVDAATKTPDGKVIFNQDIQDKDAYNALGKNISNKDVGRYMGTVDDQGNVIVEDDYQLVGICVECLQERMLRETQDLLA